MMPMRSRFIHAHLKQVDGRLSDLHGVNSRAGIGTGGDGPLSPTLNEFPL